MNDQSEFLLKEYEGTFQALLNNADRVHKITGLFQMVNAGLIALTVALVGFLKGSQSSMSLTPLGIVPLCCFLLVLGAALVGLLVVVYLLRLRFRDIWCYNRMNLIRRIFLDDVQLGSALNAYVSSPYGSTETYQITPRRFFRSDTIISAAIVAVISCSWAAIGGFLWPNVSQTNSFIIAGLCFFLACAANAGIFVVAYREARRLGQPALVAPEQRTNEPSTEADETEAET